MGSFLYEIANAVLGLLVWAIIINAVISWLIAFDVINMRHRFVYSLVRFLDAVTRPILWPFQKVIPSLGGVDITPILAIIVIEAARRHLLPLIFGPLVTLLG